MNGEITFVRSHDHCEVMAHYHNGQPTQVYAHADSLPHIPGVNWTTGKNSAFRYADDPNAAVAYLQEHFNLTDDTAMIYEGD